MTSFLDRLASGEPLVLDGATGTELSRRGIDTRLPLWSARALIEQPAAVRAIHADYVAAGAEIITTNTFRTHRRTLGRAGFGHRAHELTQLAVRLAREAIEQSPADRAVFVAGSMSPLEDCYSPQLVPSDDELRVEHDEMAHDLAQAGCDLLLVETMNTIREAVIATQAAVSTGRPVCVSFVAGPGDRPPDDPAVTMSSEETTLLSGESIEDAVAAVRRWEPAVVMVNCVPLGLIDRAFDHLCAVCDGPIGLYANVGRADDRVGWELTDDVLPEAYARRARQWLARGAAIVGGCCGTTPDHIAAIRPIIATMN